jgi:hypothetical protein
VGVDHSSSPGVKEVKIKYWNMSICKILPSGLASLLTLLDLCHYVSHLPSYKESKSNPGYGVMFGPVLRYLINLSDLCITRNN